VLLVKGEALRGGEPLFFDKGGKTDGRKRVVGIHVECIWPNIAERNESSSSGSSAIPDSDTFEIQGTVVHKNIDGGFFAIEGDDGRKYNPINLSESFRKDDLKVKLTARLIMDAMSIHMYGAIIEVVEIAAK
jgi:hypothetical protein